MLRLPNCFSFADVVLRDLPKLSMFDQDACKAVAAKALGSTSGSCTCGQYLAATAPPAAKVPRRCLSGSSTAHPRSGTGLNVAQWLAAANFFAPCFC